MVAEVLCLACQVLCQCWSDTASSGIYVGLQAAVIVEDVGCLTMEGAGVRYTDIPLLPGLVVTFFALVFWDVVSISPVFGLQFRVGPVVVWRTNAETVQNVLN